MLALPKRIARFYINGFKEMKLGKTLWLIIIIKLFIMFVILRVFFFKPHLKQFDSEESKQEYVSDELIRRGK